MLATQEILAAVLLIENPPDDTTEDQYLGAWQYLIDTGVVWFLQGWYGRTAHDFIKAGVLRPADATLVNQTAIN